MNAEADSKEVGGESVSVQEWISVIALSRAHMLGSMQIIFL